MKPLTSFSMNFKTRWNTLAAIFLAVSFFLRVIEFSVVSDATTASTNKLVFSLIVPLFFTLVGLILLRAFRLQHPLVYSILGACLCIMVICFNFGSGDVVRIVMSILWYLFCCVLLVGTALGYVPWNLPVSAAIALAIGIRFLLYTRAVAGLSGKMIEFSALSILAAVFCLTRCFIENRDYTY